MKLGSDSFLPTWNEELPRKKPLRQEEGKRTSCLWKVSWNGPLKWVWSWPSTYGHWLLKA